MGQAYIDKYPYRNKYLNGSAEEQQLVNIVANGFGNVQRGYWQQFGYQIGGPVCYSFAKWLAEQIDSRLEITDIAFIARDGYLLQKIYSKLPHDRKVKTHYVYAPRAVKNVCFADNQAKEEYSAYIKSLAIGQGTVATVDSITMLFSGQKLIVEMLDNPVIGFCWGILGANKNLQKKLKVYTFQPERYHVIRNWNVIEFIMTSPEPPVMSVKGGLPAYYPASDFEQIRPIIFAEIEKGVMDFVNDVLTKCEALPSFSNQVITEWVNDFLLNPNEEDRTAFEPIMFSETAEHSDCIPLNAFAPLKDFSLPTMKDKIWWWSQEHPIVYTILHYGKIALKKLTGQ